MYIQWALYLSLVARLESNPQVRHQGRLLPAATRGTKHSKKWAHVTHNTKEDHPGIRCNDSISRRLRSSTILHQEVIPQTSSSSIKSSAGRQQVLADISRPNSRNLRQISGVHHCQPLTVRHHRDQKRQTQVLDLIRPDLCIPPTPMKTNSEHPRGSAISKAPDQTNSRPTRLPSHPIKCPASPGSSFPRK